MKKVVSLSGGESSRFLANEAILQFGRENVDFVCMDTGAEDELTYKFIRRIDKLMKLDLVCLRGDFNQPLGKGVGFNIIDVNDMKTDLKPYKAMMKKYGVPYMGGMFCTDRMKLKPYKKYCDNKYGRRNYETWLGIRFDEPKRLWGINVKYPLKSCYGQLVKCGLDDYGISMLFRNLRNGEESISKLDDVTELAKELMTKRLDALDKENLHYLAEISDCEKPDTLIFSKNSPVSLNLPEWRGNCKLCPKKSDLKLVASKIDDEDHYDEFVSALNDDSVRTGEKTGSVDSMYRKKRSLESLIATFDGISGDEIKARIRGSKMIDTNSCSESCEVFN